MPVKPLSSWTVVGDTIDFLGQNLTTTGNITARQLKLYDPDDDATLTFVHDRVFQATLDTTVTIASVRGGAIDMVLDTPVIGDLLVIGLDQDYRVTAAPTWVGLTITGPAGISVSKVELGGGWGVESNTFTIDAGGVDGSTGFGVPGSNGSSCVFETGAGGDSFASQSGDGGDFRVKLGAKGIGQAGGTDGIDGVYQVGDGGTTNYTQIDILGNLELFGSAVLTSNGRIEAIERFTGADTLDANNEVAFCDGTFTLSLPAGILGTRYRIVNTGTGTITVAPNGAENLLGENSNWILNEGEALIINYDATEGWF